MKIIFEDNHLLVVEKPVGILSQEDKTGHEDMAFLLKKYLKEKYRKPGNVYIGHVHRLDRMVGGIMVFGRTSKAASRLCGQMREGKFQKKYLAVCEGVLEQKKNTLSYFLKKNRETNTVDVSPFYRVGYKKAVLDYRVKEEKEKLSLLEIILQTGRSHQIRAQFKQLGHPLYADAKYGTKKKEATIALWSYGLSFDHPTKNEPLSFICEPPAVVPWSLFSKQQLKNP